jgi:hypothetical protein
MRVAKSWGVRPWELDKWFDMPRERRAMLLAFEREQARVEYWSYEWGKDSG